MTQKREKYKCWMISGMHFSEKKFMDYANELVKSVHNQKEIKSAVLGIKRILLKAINLVTKTKIYPFDSKAKALDFLVAD